MSPDSATLGSIATRQLEALALAAGLEGERARMLAVLERVSRSWADRRAADQVRWSGISDDCSPIEWSIKVGGSKPELRILVEPQRDPASPASYYRASCELARELAMHCGANLDLFDRVEDLFSPSEHVYFSAFVGAVFWPGAEPMFKLYLNPAAHGVSNARKTMESALAKLGYFSSWAPIARELSRDDEVQFLCLDLSPQEGSRVKLYLRHRSATIERMERLACLAQEHVPGDFRTFSSTMLESPSFPRPPLTMLSLAEGSARPLQAALHLPTFPFVGPDSEARARLLSLGERFGIPASVFEPYSKCIDVLAEGPLEEERGIHNYVSFQRKRGTPLVTAYLSSRMFLSRLGRIGANPSVAWPSPVMRSPPKSSWSAEAGRELQRLIAPMPVAEFASEWFAKKPLLIRGSPEKISGLFDRERFDRAIEKASHLGATFSSRHALDVRPVDVPELYRGGATICATEIERGDPELEQLALAIKTQIGHAGRVTIRAYLSPDGSGFDTHFDSVVATVIQIEGKKRWRYSTEPAVPHPRFNASQTAAGSIEYVRPSGVRERPWERLSPPDESSFSEVVLEPGDVLCLPPGIWHQARACGHSLALNLSFRPHSFWELLTATIEPALLSREEWRATLPLEPFSAESSGELPPDLAAHFAERIAELHRMLDQPDLQLSLANAWRRALVSSEGRKTRTIEPVSPDDVLQVMRSAPIRFGYGPAKNGERALFVGFAPTGAELAFPPEILPFFQALAAQDRFVASSATSWSDHPWPEVKRLLERLLESGIIERD